MTGHEQVEHGGLTAAPPAVATKGELALETTVAAPSTKVEPLPDVTEDQPVRPGLIMCVCSGRCPSYASLDVWDFMNRVRAELPVRFATVHPYLCATDGGHFLADLLQARRPMLIAGCAPHMQYELFRDAFTAQSMEVHRDMVPVDIFDLTTEEAVGRVAVALADLGLTASPPPGGTDD